MLPTSNSTTTSSTSSTATTNSATPTSPFTGASVQASSQHMLTLERRDLSWDEKVTSKITLGNICKQKSLNPQNYTMSGFRSVKSGQPYVILERKVDAESGKSPVLYNARENKLVYPQASVGMPVVNASAVSSPASNSQIQVTRLPLSAVTKASYIFDLRAVCNKNGWNLSDFTMSRFQDPRTGNTYIVPERRVEAEAHKVPVFLDLATNKLSYSYEGVATVSAAGLAPTQAQVEAQPQPQLQQPSVTLSAPPVSLGFAAPSISGTVPNFDRSLKPTQPPKFDRNLKPKDK